ncbi:MAG: hypothetical protein VKN72_25455 [Nostocales cyanobacterium 94392]|nr:hypothetical protein [Nostocales cyanobacterium 94392]
MKIKANMQKSGINYFFYALIFYNILILYLLPYNVELPHARIFLPLLAMILIVQLLYNKTQILITDILLVCSILIITFINFSTYHLFRYSLPICLMVIGFSGCPQIRIKRNYLIGLCWLTTVALIYQMIFFRRVEFDGSSRISLSNGDPNVSGLFMLLFFFICWKAKFKPGIILSLVSTVLFLSRNYFLSLFIYLIIIVWEKKFIAIAKKINFTLFFICSNMVGYLIGEYFLNFVQIGYTYDTSASRLFSFNDTSNLARFEANRFLVTSYQNDLTLALKGYADRYNEAFKEVGSLIHNSFLEVIAYIGVPLGFLYFCAILKVVGGYYTPNNYKFIFPYLFFCLFLHSGLQGLAPLLFVSILAMSVEDNKVKVISPY